MKSTPRPYFRWILISIFDTIFSLFQGFNQNLVIYTYYSLSITELITSYIRLHIEYLTPTFNIIMLLLHVALLAVFNAIFYLAAVLLLGVTLYVAYCNSEFDRLSGFVRIRTGG